MSERMVQPLYFSPSATTQKIIMRVAQCFEHASQPLDLLAEPAPRLTLSGPDDALLLAGAPVFSGRIPEVCASALRRLTGNGAPAIAVVVYGNRAYEDALLELVQLLRERGFNVIAAAAFVAQHSIFPEVAAGRPDAADYETIDAFGRRCAALAERFPDGETAPLAVPGSVPYRAPGGVPLHPTGSGACTGCGACARICPAQAIDPENPRKTDKARCVTCTACITLCPVHARAFHGPVYQAAALAFQKKCADRREAEVFFPFIHSKNETKAECVEMLD